MCTGSRRPWPSSPSEPGRHLGLDRFHYLDGFLAVPADLDGSFELGRHNPPPHR